MRRKERGFTLIELMIVVVIMGILVAIGLPNFFNMSIRAKVAEVKSSMHTTQVTIEDFATRNDSVYPVNAAATTSEGGLAFANLLPGGTALAPGTPPNNPFTFGPTVYNWGAAAGTPYGGPDPAGGIQINTWGSGGGAIDSYQILGEDDIGTMMTLVLTNR